MFASADDVTSCGPLADPEGVPGDVAGQPDMGQTGHCRGVRLHYTFSSLETPAGQRLCHPGPLHRHEGRGETAVQRCCDFN